MKISVGPTGAVVKGSVLDVNVRTLTRLVQNYDPLLYFVWNPKKQYRMGVWELWRRPTHKKVKEVVTYKGNSYSIIDYVPHPLENHVWDLPILGYDLLQRLKDGDQFAMCNYEVGKEHRLSRHNEKMTNTALDNKYKAKQKARDDMMYALRQDKSIIKDFQEKLLSGVDPNHLMRFWGK